MIFVVIIGGAMSGSKSVGFGIWYWGYTAWKMYKRDNDALVWLQKIMLWFEAMAFSIALAVLLFSDSDVRRYVDVTPIGLIIIATLSMGVTYLLYKFFKGQKNIGLNSALIGGKSSIDDRFWEQASRELEADRHEATWARAMASAEGDEAKTKALYLKIRSSDLQRNAYLANVESKILPIQDTDVVKEESKLFWSSFNQVGKIAIIGIVALIGYAIYDSTTSLNVGSSNPVGTTNQAPKAPIPEQPIKSIDEVKNLCYVYWDGVRWNLGETEGENFARFSRDRYGVKVVELAIPRQMANEFNLSNKVGEKIENRRFEEFMNTYWYQVMSLCEFN